MQVSQHWRLNAQCYQWLLLFVVLGLSLLVGCARSAVEPMSDVVGERDVSLVTETPTPDSYPILPDPTQNPDPYALVGVVVTEDFSTLLPRPTETETPIPILTPIPTPLSIHSNYEIMWVESLWIDKFGPPKDRPRATIWRADPANIADKELFYTFPTDEHIAKAVLSPDGNYIALLAQPSELVKGNLYLFSIQTKELVEVNNTVVDFSWNNDGTILAFHVWTKNASTLKVILLPSLQQTTLYIINRLVTSESEPVDDIYLLGWQKNDRLVIEYDQMIDNVYWRSLLIITTNNLEISRLGLNINNLVDFKLSPDGLYLLAYDVEDNERVVLNLQDYSKHIIQDYDRVYWQPDNSLLVYDKTSYETGDTFQISGANFAQIIKRAERFDLIAGRMSPDKQWKDHKDDESHPTYNLLHLPSNTIVELPNWGYVGPHFNHVWFLGWFAKEGVTE